MRRHHSFGMEYDIPRTKQEGQAFVKGLAATFHNHVGTTALPGAVGLGFTWHTRRWEDVALAWKTVRTAAMAAGVLSGEPYILESRLVKATKPYIELHIQEATDDTND